MPVVLQGAGDALVLPGPLLTAAGCAGDVVAFCRQGWAQGLGSVVTRSIALQPQRMRRGAVRETVAGVLYPAAPVTDRMDTVLRRAAPAWPGLATPVIASIHGTTRDEIAALAAELGPLPGVAALELNLLAPAGEPEDARWVEDATEVAVAVAGCPIIVKLSPEGDIAVRVAAAAAGGACAAVVGHGRPAALPGVGDARLAGPAIWPLTLRVIAVAAEAATIGVIACGGVVTEAQARGLLAAGASAVQVGTALLRDPRIAATIAAQLSAFLDPPAAPA